MNHPEPTIALREALADVRVRAPTRGNRRFEQHIEVIARIEAEHEQRLIPVFRI